MRIKYFLLALATIFFQHASAQAGSAIVGNWKAEDDTKKIEIQISLVNENTYVGKVINSADNNGKLLFENLQYNSSKNNYTGTMTPPGVGMSLNATVTMEGNNRIKIKAQKLLMSKTIYLKRIK